MIATEPTALTGPRVFVPQFHATRCSGALHFTPDTTGAGPAISHTGRPDASKVYQYTVSSVSLSWYISAQLVP